MNSLEFDVDPIGGLMPQILALTAPPGTRDNNRQPFQQPQSQNASSSQVSTNGNGQSKAGEAGLAAHPYFRRPGRGHNHDCCDACSEGGDLICCDLCPASFHLTCHDPPLDEDEIPTGEWACHQCRMGGNEDDRTSNSSGKSTKSSKQSKKKEKDEPKPKEENDRKVFAGGREIEISNTPLSTLIKAAAVINPTQFTLPYELTLPANFPGEPKDNFIRKNGTRRGLAKKKPYELDNGLVPLPAKLCFQCNKSCRMGPLIPCDFCPLFYHLDCLEPPLTTPPMGRWMCPNHPEHHMDTSLLTSHSLTERVKLWDKFSVPLDQDSVKLKFLQNCHRANPPFRYKVKKALRTRLRVPAAIKAHYQDPPDLLPHLSPSQLIPFPDPYDQYPPPPSPSPPPSPPSKSISPPPADPPLPGLKEEQPMEVDDEPVPPCEPSPPHHVQQPPTKEEKDQWLASLLSLQSSIIRHMSGDSLPPRDVKKESCNGVHPPNPAPPSVPSSPPPIEPRPNILNGDLMSMENKPLKMCLDGMSNHNHISHSSAFTHPQTSVYLTGSKKSSHKNQKNKFSSSSKSLRPKKNTSTEILSDTLSALEISLREKIDGNNEVPLNSLEQSVVDVLAQERLKEILEPEKPSVVFSTLPVAARALLCPLVPDIRLKDFDTKYRRYSKQPVPMTYRILNIGKGSHNHVNLELYGHCNYISPHHASIMFDETTGHYELLNYSEFATRVDGVTYTCDFAERTVSQAVPPPFLQHVKAIIAKRRGVMQLQAPPPAMSSRPGEDLVRCECRRTQSPTGKVSGGWEGTAVLHHGSYIRCGCVKFVFSVVEEASKGDWSRDTAITYEKFLKAADEERETENEKESEKEKEKEKEREKKRKKESEEEPENELKEKKVTKKEERSSAKS